MKRFNDMNKTFKLAMLGSALALAAGPASAEVYELCAGATTIDLPDGSSAPMWGYASGGATGGVCDNAPTIPGPRLTVTDGTLTINLTNTLPEPTSIVIPGLPMPAGGPTWNDGTTGPRTSATQRVRSFGAEVLSGATGSYDFTVDRPGTFLYHSGTHPQKQVYMGLGGPVTQDTLAAVPPALAEAYPGVPYAQDIVLFYSEIDPDLNAAIVGGSYQTSIDYHARWFLVNGEPYSTACTDLVDNVTKLAPPDGLDDASGYPCASMAQTDPILAGVAKTPTLLRFLSTAGETHVPTLQGLHMTIHAEDGLQYTWQDGATVMDTAPRQQYSVMLPPLKTKDAIIEPQLDGTYALYDGNGYMTNPTDPEDFDHKDPVGGMLRFLSVGADGNLPPIGVADTATVVEGGTITIDVLANDSDPEGQPLTIAGTIGTAVCDIGVVGGTCEYTGSATTPTFTYDVSDGPNTTTNVLVTVTVEPNVAPIANADSATTDAGIPVTINVLANDIGQPGETLAIASFAPNSANGSTVSCDTVTGDCSYTPNVAGTTDTFTYTATDGTLSAAATVTITVNAVVGNVPPVASDDAYNVIEDGILSVAAVNGVLANDTDADADPMTAILVTGPTNADANGFNLLDTGAFFYRPATGFNGTDTFTYIANDGRPSPEGDSNIATVTITVNPGNDIPVANNDTVYLKSMYVNGQVTAVPAPGVLVNDTDVDGDTLTAVLDTGVDGPAVLVMGTNGDFTYTTSTPDNIALGTVDTFTYFANDGNVNSTFPATVTLVRKLTVIQAVCERRNNGNCDWRIEGDKLEAGGRVEAWFGGTRIGRTAPTGAGPWTISVNNSQVNTGLGPIDFRVSTDGNAEILAYPPTEQ